MGKYGLHTVDVATHFCAASFSRSQSAAEIWRTIQAMWTLVYIGPPGFFSVDPGTSYISREMRDNLESEGFRLLQDPVDNPGKIGVLKRYHAPLRAAFTKIRKDLYQKISDNECLRMAVFSVNATVGPEGLCPILLVFGVIPRPARAKASPRRLDRAKAISDSIIEVEREQARSRISFGRRRTGGLKRVESSEELRRLPMGSQLLVYRKTTKKWEGPFTFNDITGKTVVVQTRIRRIICRSTCVKPYVASTLLSTSPR